MKLLVTGAAGFIGANFVHYWLKKYPNDEVRVIDALTYAGNIANLDPVKKQIKFFEANINDRAKVAEAMAGVDAVVHFAAESHVDRSIYDPAKYWHTNVHGTLALLEEAKKNGVYRFHHISTDEVYGELPFNSDIKFTEKTPYSPKPDNIYALSKAEADYVVRDFAAKNDDMYITISNCSNNFGPFQFPEKFIPIIITNIIDGIKVPVHGDGRNVRDWIYVEDHASAVDVILQNGKKGETYLVGSNNDKSNRYVATRVVELCGADASVINNVPDRHSNDRRYAIDATKLVSELGWKPQIDGDNFDDGLKETISWFKNNQDWWRALLTKKDTVSDSGGNLKAFISLDRVKGKTKFEFNEMGVNGHDSSGFRKITKEDFLQEMKIRRQIVIKNLEDKKWYQSSPQEVKDKTEFLAEDPDTFGFVEDLSSREDVVNDKKINKLLKIEYSDVEGERVYGIAAWFEVEDKKGQKESWGYYSWGRGQKSGSKIAVLVKNKDKITHLVFRREQKFATSSAEYTLAGGFSRLNEGLLDFVARNIYVDLDIDFLKADAEIKEIISLGRLSPDTGMTSNKPTLYSVIVELKNKYADISEDQIIENEDGVVIWPISKMADLINKVDDAYFLAAAARLLSEGIIKLKV
jgi:dTDP-glucose 4,6-dehydratase